jgi:hypothetical protein
MLKINIVTLRLTVNFIIKIMKVYEVKNVFITDVSFMASSGYHK